MASPKEYSLAEVFRDPVLFFGFLKIRNKKGEVVPFKMNVEQQKLLEAYKNRDGKNILVLKPRQIGTSTFFSALLFWMWYTSSKPITIYSMSHTFDSAKNAMSMYKTFWENLPAFLKVRDLEKDNTQTLKLLDTGATLEIRSAGGKGGIRSFSCNVLHLSEFAFYSDPEELLATAIPALNDGILIIESTANYWNDALHQQIVKAREDKGSNFQFIFFPWSEHYDYRIPRTTVTDLTEEERLLMDRFDLNGLQIAWRRRKIIEMGWSKFRRDYPLTIEEAYSLSSDAWLSSYEVEDIIPVTGTDGVTVFEDMKPKTKYAIGVDVATGVGKDFSVIYVLDVRTRQAVYCFRSNTIQLPALANKIQEISVRYNNAKVLVERNSIGEVIYSEFKHIGFYNYWKDANGDGWLTTSKNKPVILSDLRKAFSAKMFDKLDVELIDQLRTIRVDPTGNADFSSRDNGNGHYDNIMAFALALQCAMSIPIETADKKFNNILEQHMAAEKSSMMRGTLRPWK